MSDAKETKNPVSGQSGDFQPAQSDTTHKPQQGVKDETEHCCPPPPEILRSLSNKEFTAWGEYLEKEKPKEYIRWKMQMIGEGPPAPTNQNARIENQQAGGQLGISSGPSSMLQEEMPSREQKHDETLETKEMHDTLEKKVN
ncbi:uncharacterized protein PV07_01568 [Cladophialophora immunda]|uniref:Uncharacterized protein n=1 Tax=Cladophialophora immunda TaxID=569365 RepID=A0A0D2CY00_9EURO|nr:uncharacterized protein PV07_01568 [Cladophialophora immunda]KIW34815.1 hypothetical protein PV07_01568 [Cladophialophora immunda]OQV06366.1 hypothetical protein CLAIMM_10937 [Cladophialophora immunda]